MDRTERAKAQHAFRKGLRDLVAHRADKAVPQLRAAVEATNPDRKGLLAERLYWLSVALLRLDRVDLAIASLASAQKLRPRGYARDAWEVRSNCYGMRRRASPELDDFHAFHSIQITRYLGTRPSHRYASAAESELIMRLVATAWLGLRKGGQLEGASVERRLALFSGCSIDFPRPETRQASGCGDGIVAVDFKRGRVLRASDRCSCGSGLSWCRCCGRTKSPREL
ncbi:MAG: hypothetical protein ACOYM2_02985 [Rectinemataceae bacterium]